MNFFGRVFSSLTGSSTPISGFEYDFKIDDPASVTVSMPCGVTWTVRNGTRTSSSSSTSASSEENSESSKNVSIFSCPIPPSSSSTSTSHQLVQNVLKRSKGLVALPGILRCLDCVESDNVAYLATERCVPLRNVASRDAISFYSKSNTSSSTMSPSSSSSDVSSAIIVANGENEQQQQQEEYDDQHRFEVAVSFGIYTVAGALSGMHKNNLFHGQVNIDSVFVLADSGEWRLFGLEFVAPISDITEQVTEFRNAASVMAPHRVAPEAGGIGGANPPHRIPQPTVHLADSWGLGILLLEVFSLQQQQQSNHSSSSSCCAPTSPNELRTSATKFVPRQFLSSFNNLVNINPRMRWSIDRFRAESDMIHGTSKVVKLMSELDELTLKDSADRDSYYRELASCVGEVPQKLAAGLILTKISNQLHYGGGVSAAALGPVLQIAQRMTSSADFAVRVGPSVLVMFGSQEPLVRMKLLESANMYARLLPEKLACEKIWPLYVQGLTSKIPELRELSVRALVHFAPVLGERFTSGDVVKAILSLQQDAQGAIRTNTTICLGMLAKYIPQETRAKTLCNGLGRMLKDPFAPSRTAAVKTITSLADNFTAQMVAEMLLPALCPMLLDTDRAAREAATKAVRELTEFAVQAAHEIPFAAAPAPAAPTAQHHQQTHSTTSNNNSATNSESPTPVAPRTPVVRNASPATSSMKPSSSSSSSAVDDDNAFAPPTRSLLGAPSPSSSATVGTTTPTSGGGGGLRLGASSSSSKPSAPQQQQQQQLPTNDLWDDVEFSIPSSSSNKKTGASGGGGFKPSSSSSSIGNGGGGGNSSSSSSAAPKPANTSGASAWEDDGLFGDDDAEFSVAPTKQQKQPASSSTITPTTATTTTVVVPLSSSTGGMKLDGSTSGLSASSSSAAPVKKRGFGLKKSA